MYTTVADNLGLRPEKPERPPSSDDGTPSVSIIRQSIGGLPERGTASIHNDRIHVDTSATVSLPLGVMTRTLRETSQVIPTDAIQHVTTTQQHCPCDFFAAAGAILLGSLGTVNGVGSDGVRGGAVGAVTGAASGGVLGYAMCNAMCKERTDLAFKMADGSVETVGVESSQDSAAFVRAIGAKMEKRFRPEQ